MVGTELLTVGHGTLASTDLLTLLDDAGVEVVVDVRTAPGSRRNPQFGHDALREMFHAHGTGYRWDERLGGFRKMPAGSPDTNWRNRSFRAYAGHMRTDEFLAGIEDLLSDAGRCTTTVMCGEAVWWHCHRRMIADFAEIARGIRVSHLMHDGKLVPNRPIEGVRLGNDGLIVYDGGQQQLG